MTVQQNFGISVQVGRVFDSMAEYNSICFQDSLLHEGRDLGATEFQKFSKWKGPMPTLASNSTCQ